MGDELRIRNWDKWQSYRKDRGQPPWIKIHRCVMRNPEWVSLTDAERGQLVAIWLLAADRDGAIPASPELIAKLCFMDSVPDINKFIKLSFIDPNGCHCDATMTPTRRQHDQPEKNRVEKNRVGPPTLDQVVSYFVENGYSADAGRRAFKYYAEGDPPWHDSNGKRVKAWKQKMRGVWFKPENALVNKDNGDQSAKRRQAKTQELIDKAKKHGRAPMPQNIKDLSKTIG